MSNISKIIKTSTHFLTVAVVFFMACRNLFMLPATAMQPKIVRVGFYPMNDFHKLDKNRQPAGYDVDMLETLLQYTPNWKIEYVESKSREESLTQLRNGEIDLIGGIQKSHNIDNDLAFCSYSSGNTYHAISALPESPLVYMDLAALDGIKVGVLGHDLKLDALTFYLLKANANVELIYYDTLNELFQALKNQEVDAINSDMMEIPKNTTKIIAKYAPSDFYYAVKHDNNDLLYELEVAMAKVMLNDHWAPNSINMKYYKDAYTIPLSKAELDFSAESEVIRVGVPIYSRPLSWLDSSDGKIKGITPDILKEISRVSGLKFVLEAVPSDTIITDAISTTGCRMVAGLPIYGSNTVAKLAATDIETISQSNIRLSVPYLQSQAAVFAKSDKDLEVNNFIKVITTTDFPMPPQLTNPAPNDNSFALERLSTIEQCLDALISGRADALIHNIHIVDLQLRDMKYNAICMVPTTGVDGNLAMAVNKSENPLLLSTINHSIALISQQTIDQIILNHTVGKTSKITISGFFMQYKREIIFGILVFILLLAILINTLMVKRKSHNLIKESEFHLSNITNNINGGVITLMPDKGFPITYVNNGFLQLIGYKRGEYENFGKKESISYIHPDDLGILNQFTQLEEDGQQLELELRIKHKTKGYIPTIFRGTFSTPPTGIPLLYCVVVDISAQKLMMEDLATQKERYQIIVEQSHDIFFEVNQADDTVTCTPKYKEVFGYELTEIIIFENNTMSAGSRINDSDKHVFSQMLKGFEENEREGHCRVRIQNAHDVYIWCDVQINMVSYPNRPLRIVGQITDAQEEVNEKNRLTELSQMDQLTGLYNKTAFKRIVEDFISNPHMSEERAAVFFIDMDHFKQVNDKLGHMVGDEAIVNTAKLLKGIFREQDMVGRFGGDEFFIFTRGVPHSALEEKATTICDKLRVRYYDKESQSQYVDISGSIGIFVFLGGDNLTYDRILEKADEALYDAKQSGRDTFRFKQ